jgi:hypothetical protein
MICCRQDKLFSQLGAVVGAGVGSRSQSRSFIKAGAGAETNGFGSVTLPSSVFSNTV